MPLPAYPAPRTDPPPLLSPSPALLLPSPPHHRTHHHTQELGLMPEESLPPDGADTWVMSAYLTRRCALGALPACVRLCLCVC